MKLNSLKLYTAMCCVNISRKMKPNENVQKVEVGVEVLLIFILYRVLCGNTVYVCSFTGVLREIFKWNLACTHTLTHLQSTFNNLI